MGQEAQENESIAHICFKQTTEGIMWTSFLFTNYRCEQPEFLSDI